jgi:nucleotide-binding universal stress UspA family protein
VGTIVVDVDVSESSERALEFALREARLRSARLHVVRAPSRWSEMVTGADEPLPWPAGVGAAFEQIPHDEDPELARWLGAVGNRTRVHDVTADLETRTGEAPDVLCAR